jgi:geranylgeranyl reductase family protein
METERFDAMVVGAGPAGSVAALVLARGGARVALIDKTAFPRDKACGDLVGPRGVRLLEDLGVEVKSEQLLDQLDELVLIGPTGRRVRVPYLAGDTYPGHGFCLPRTEFDAALHRAATDAGAEPIVGRVNEPIHDARGELEGFVLSTGRALVADIVIGADGSTSRVASAAGLVDPDRVLWAFAIRAYIDDPVNVPFIAFWEERPWRGFPGYGWLFPGAGGRANVGLGVGVRSRRADGNVAARRFDAFVEHLRKQGVLVGSNESISDRLGGWLKMGMVGTNPAKGRVLLVGDAAGLINPLQGEGIHQAMESAWAAAEAVLAGPHQAALAYRAHLRSTYVPYLATTAPMHAATIGHPMAVAASGRLLTAPGIGRAMASSWSIFWNDHLDGAPRGGARRGAAALAGFGRVATSPSPVRRWFGQLHWSPGGGVLR